MRWILPRPPCDDRAAIRERRTEAREGYVSEKRDPERINYRLVGFIAIAAIVLYSQLGETPQGPPEPEHIEPAAIPPDPEPRPQPEALPPTAEMKPKEPEPGGFSIGPNKLTLRRYGACPSEDLLDEFRTAEKTGDVHLGGALLSEGCIFLKGGMHATALDLVGIFPPIAKIRLYGEGGGMVFYTSALAIVDEVDYPEMAKRRDAELEAAK